MNLGNRNNQASFTQTPSVNTPRSVFDRSFAIKDTFNFDYLTPLYVDEILPGDTVNLNLKSFIRLPPQVVPVLDNMYIDYFFFFVPTRLIWDNWEKFNGAQDNPGDFTDYLVPVIGNIPGNIPYDGMLDHMGLPAGQPFGGDDINALPLRAYNLIWNQWFRDQDLQASIPVPKGAGPDNLGDYILRKRSKKPDYFTTARPTPQKGPAMVIPFNNPSQMAVASNGESILVRANNPTPEAVLAKNSSDIIYTGGIAINEPIRFGTETGLTVPYTSAYQGTINELRQAIALQSLLELDMRGGTRYIEVLKAHWNVTSPDFRLQRAEFLSSGTTMINQHPIAQTSSSDATSPQGNLAAFSTSSANGQIGFSKSFTEHGYIIGLVQARGEVTYQQGLNRMWTRKTRWDFFWPKLQDLGEQAVLRKEIFYTGDDEENETVFGYQERYADYKYRPSEIRGQFRSSHPESLDVWHLAEYYAPGSPPQLNSSFIQQDTPIERVLVVPDPAYPQLLADYWLSIKHARVMFTHSIPGHMGRL